MYLRVITGTAGVALLVLTPLAAAQSADDPPAPPSIAQLCAATGIEEVDALLADIARSDLVDDLSPLTSLVVPDSESVEIDASVQLEDVRQALNCTPDPTADPEPDPNSPPADDDADDPPAALPDADDDGGLDLAPAPTIVDDGVPVTG